MDTRAPDMFGLDVSVLVLTIVVLGGLGSAFGAIVGAVVLVGAPEVFRPFHDYRLIGHGLLLLGLIRFRRGASLATDSSGAARPTLLELRGIAKRYGGLQVVDALNLRIGRGETIAIIGPNGSGKTTTLDMIAGNLLPDAGEAQARARPRAR